MKKRKLNFLNIIFFSLLITAFDQITKYLAFNLLMQSSEIIIIPGYVQLKLTQNTGAAFSLFSQSTQFLTFLSASATIFIVIWLWRNQPLSILQGLGFGFLLGGTIGNGLDRFRVGFVTDFIELIPIEFPIFNLADIAINIAISCLIVNSLKGNKLKHE